MQISLDKSDFAAALSPAMATVSSGSTISAIEGVLIDARADGTIVFTTYDMEKGTRVRASGRVGEEGEYVISAQKLYDIVRAMPDGEIRLTVDEKLGVRVTGGVSSMFELKAISGENFPALPELSSENRITMPQHIFKDFVTRTAFACSQSDPRPGFRAALVKAAPDPSGAGCTIGIVTCDGNRLAKCETYSDAATVSTKDASDVSFLVPGKALYDFSRIAADSEDDMTVFCARKHAIFVIGDVTYFCRRIEAEFIDYERIIPASQDKEMIVSATELRRSLERASLVTEDKTAGSVRTFVRLDLGDGRLRVSSASANGSVYDELAVVESGDPIVIGFNCRFLLDALRSAGDCTIRIKLSSPLMGVGIEPADPADGSWYYFIMPVRMMNQTA
jgi:DNA polymerase-3 subunit beta